MPPFLPLDVAEALRSQDARKEALKALQKAHEFLQVAEGHLKHVKPPDSLSLSKIRDLKNQIPNL